MGGVEVDVDQYPMRKMCGVFSWSGDDDELLEGEDRLSNGVMDLEVRDRPSCFTNHRPFHHNPSTGVHCSLFGYLSNIDDLRVRFGLPRASAAEIAGHAFSAGLLATLDGVFLAVTVEERRKRCTVSQSASGSSLPLYYSANGSRFVFATGLKELLVHRGGTRELDHEAVRDFLHYGYMIPNERTLLRGVNKLVPGKQLVVDYGRRCIDIVDGAAGPAAVLPDRGYARKALVESITGCTDSISRQLKSQERRLTLTAGWDCNLLLHTLRRSFDGPITAVTLGVGDAFDETRKARAIVEGAYQRTRHLSGSVPSDCVESLPAIVWELEGYLFEGGVFLRHHLARSFPPGRPEAVFLGVGADQVLFAETALKQWLRTTKNMANPVWRFRRSVRPGGPNTGYTILIDFNLKMHELPLNAHGGMGLYPFVNRNTLELSRALGILLNWRKRYYRKRLQDILGPKVTRHLAPKGPVLDTLAIFRASRDTVVRALKPDLLETWLEPAQIDRLMGDQDKYHIIILQLAYLCVFYDLFVGEHFDRYRDQRCLAIPLSEFSG